MNNETLNNLKKAALVLNAIPANFWHTNTIKETKACARAVVLAVKEIENNRRAIIFLSEEIDGDSPFDQILSEAIRILKGE